MKKTTFILLFFAFIGLSCKKETKQPRKQERDLEQIKASGELVAITLSSSISYFIYKGEPMGYDFELIKDFADSLGVDLKIKVAQNVNKLTEMLENGEGDIIAYYIPITNELKTKVLYCGQEAVDEQVLVQRAHLEDTILTDVVQLIGKEVWVIDKSRYHQRLVNLNKELGGGIKIKDIEKDTVSVEDLIGFVADGTIPYTFSDKSTARLNKTYYPGINISLIVSHPQRYSWAVNNASPKLAQEINKWSLDYQNKPRYQAIMKRYFEISKMPGEEPISFISGNQISIYDSLFRQYAQKAGLDWTLLASIAYQESKFDTSGVSWSGAAGLMGLMPKTAVNFGADRDNLKDPEENLKAAVGYIEYLNKFYKKIENSEEKIKFVLASYNAGPGHIIDAQALASKYGKDPNLWEGNVKEYVKLKRLPEYYNDSVCKLGYFRGTETLNYVEHVIERWKHYEEKLNKR